MEVLIALALLSVILGALYGTFFLSSRALDAVDETVLRLHEIRGALDAIGREADSAMFAPDSAITVFKIEDRDSYGKQTSRLSMTAFSPIFPGLSAVSYYVEEKDGKLTLYKKIAPAGGNAEAEPAEVMEDIRAFSAEAKEADKWIKTWNAKETGKVPDEIRIGITVMIKDRPLTVTQTFRPKIGKSI